MDFDEAVIVCALLKRRKNKRNKYWVHPLWGDRMTKGKFYTFYPKLRLYPDKFFEYFRMSVNSFDELVELLKPTITYQNTNMRLSVPPEERLAVTLRYFATGASFKDLSFDYLMGVTTAREIVYNTCIQIWNVLQPEYMSEKSDEDWLAIANQFYTRTYFPNVIGAVDGKHIRRKCPLNSGSEFFNYKKFFSVVLMAWVDADYQFVYIDVGSKGAAGDSAVFQNSNIGRRLQQNLLNIPNDRALPYDENGKPMPFVLVADEAFGLSRHIMRPYAKTGLDCKKKIYNYRQTVARRMVECTFGILCSKWRIFYRPIDVSLDFCNKIIMACCILHNYVRRKDGIQFADTVYECPLRSISNLPQTRPSSAANVRNYFAEYFTSPQGSVPWQYNKI